jgi:hypothetical protein
MRRADTTYSVLKGDIRSETEKAIRFWIDMPGHTLDGETFWFPKSQIKRVLRSHNQNEDEIEVANWLIDSKEQEVIDNPR